jgi:hypothetical protein
VLAECRDCTSQGHFRLHYKAQPVKAVWGNSHSLLSEKHGTHRYTVWAECRDCTSQETHYVSTKMTNRFMLFSGNSRCLLWERYKTHRYTVWAECRDLTSQEHIKSPLQSPTGKCSLGRQSLFFVITIRNTQIHCACRMPNCTSQETNLFSTTKSYRLMQFGETFAAYCENHTNTQTQYVGRMWSLYLTGIILVLRYRAQPVNPVWGTFAVYFKTHKEHTDTLCGQNWEFVHHRKYITSPLQIPNG